MPYKDPKKRKAALRRWYLRHKDEQILRVKAASKKIRASVYAYKAATPCMDCGQRYPHYVMDFDHVRGEKVANVANLVHRNMTLQIWKEIEKCDLVCANCHRCRTFNRSQANNKNGCDESAA
jgi:hypothetical protein